MRVEVLQPNPDSLAIVRWWLERLPMLTASERALAEEIVAMIARPVMSAHVE